MKTILIAHNYSENSYNAMSFYLANHLSLNNHVVFISHQPKLKKVIRQTTKNGSLTVYSWPFKERPTNLKSAFWYSKIHLKHKPNLIIGHFVGGILTVLISKLLTGFRITTWYYYHTIYNAIITDYGKKNYAEKLRFFRIKLFYKYFCNVLICPSELAKIDCINQFKPKNIIVINNTISDRFKQLEVETTSQIVLNYLGRLDNTKGVFELIEAFNAYCLTNENTKLFLNIAGSGNNEKLILDRIGDNRKINFFGNISYNLVDDYLKKGSFTIIPSLHDNLPTVGLESLMLGKPILISDSTGLSHYITNKKNGFVFNLNKQCLVNLFTEIDNNQFNYNDLSLNARNLFVEHFSLNKHLDSFDNLFKTIS